MTKIEYEDRHSIGTQFSFIYFAFIRSINFMKSKFKFIFSKLIIFLLKINQHLCRKIKFSFTAINLIIPNL